ncbi:AraC family transcriptional regulator N-terminal domain-containing protein [Kitasatospora sp. NPDC101183]|uniref:AraC family transcriptional regulator n=1 Tax=Kitasatospora sp. NPDC101183 TaxID=3364100 RepID=UPI0037F94FA6
MHLERLIEDASRRVRVPEGSRPQAVPQPMPGLQILRQNSPTSFQASLYEPVLCLILQGAKEITIGEQTLSFDPGDCVLVSHDLPVTSRITKAPYLALTLAVDIAAIRELYDKVADSALDGEHARVLQKHRADPGLLDAMGRYLALADSPADARVLGALTSTEIHYRLLTAPFGGMLRRLMRRDSNASAVARAIGRIREDIRSPITVPDLARQVGMSASSFHKHFKAITSTTPLQFQKDLRLLEARQLLRTGGPSVTTAAYEVGYESPSQFSREYARKFGVPPSQDLAGASATA